MIITIRLPWNAPPLRSNDRLNRYAKARVTKSIREAARILALPEARKLDRPIDYPVTVTLVWEVTTNHVRDASGPAPTAKAVTDGLVDAKLLVSDRHTIVTAEDCRIEIGQQIGVRVEIQAVNETQMPIPRPQMPPQAIRDTSRPGDTAPSPQNAQRA